MPAVLDAAGTAVESKEKQLERIDKEIESVKRRKLITIVAPGGPDKVLYVQPYDLRGKDPEELVEIIEDYVIETKWDNGFAQHVTGKRPTGRFAIRGDVQGRSGPCRGPFGHTYKIDTGNQNGEREYEEFKRVLEMHVSRLSKVPEAVPYHNEVDSNGNLDLRNITLKKEDVPLATLENYEPLGNLLKQREVISGISEPKVVEKNSEEKSVENAKVFECKECELTVKSEHGLAIHNGKFHKKEDK